MIGSTPPPVPTVHAEPSPVASQPEGDHATVVPGGDTADVEPAPPAAEPAPQRVSRRTILVGVAIALCLITAAAGILSRRTPTEPDRADARPVAAETGPAGAEPAAPPTTQRRSATVPTTIPTTTRPTTTTTVTAPATAPPSPPPAPAPTTAPAATPATVGAPPAAVPPIVQAVFATAVRSDSEDACGNPTSYQPANVVDGDVNTAWMAEGDAVGVSLTFELGSPSAVTRVGLVPGYAKLDPCTGSDRFLDLRRVTSVRWTFDDGTVIDQVPALTPDLQFVDLGRTIVTTRLTLTVLGTTPPGLDRLDHTPISEVAIL